jgi:hypothetical protein
VNITGKKVEFVEVEVNMYTLKKSLFRHLLQKHKLNDGYVVYDGKLFEIEESRHNGDISHELKRQATPEEIKLFDVINYLEEHLREP